MFSFTRKFRTVDAIRVPLQIAPIHGGLYLLLTILIALAPSIQILATANFIKAAQTTITNSSGIRMLLVPALMMFALMALQMILMPIRRFIDLRLQIKLRQTLRLAYLEKLNNLEYYHIESPAVWDIIDRLTLDFVKNHVYMEERFTEMFQQLVRLMQVLVSVISVVVVLSLQVWWLGLVMLAIAIPMLYLSYKLGGRNYDMGESNKKYHRASNNMGGVLLYRENAFERFLFNYSPQINKKWERNWDYIRKQLVKINANRILIMKLGGILSTLMAIILIMIMAYLVTQAVLDVAIFIPLVPALFALSNTLSWELSICLYATAKMQRFFCRPHKILFII